MSGRHAAEAPGSVSAPGSGSASGSADGGQDPAADATIRVVSGAPSPEELAAVTAVLTALEASAAADAAARLSAPAMRSAWSDSQRPLRQPMHPGPGQWGRHPA